MEEKPKPKGRVASIRTMERKGKYLIVADVVDVESRKWLYTVPLKDEPVFEEREAAEQRAEELDLERQKRRNL